MQDMNKTPKIINCPNFSEQDNITHAFFTRKGGLSEGIYSSLNVGIGSADEAETVQKNRGIAMASIGYEKKDLHTLYQIHSNKAVLVDNNLSNNTEADGMVTKQKGIVLGILTADCTPVLFADNENQVIGASHAGWKGAISGIIENTIKKMEEIGADRENIKAVIGPTISQNSYEVGKDFYERFISNSNENAVFFISSVNPEHYMFDLAGYIEHQLKDLGISSTFNVEMDTYKDEENFFSYRRSTHKKEPDYGRNLSAIVLN
jgi:YfiH family protein